MIRCMIVEDEPLAIELLTRYIEKVSDLDLVAVAENGVDAMDLLEKEPVDLIFLDVNLPRLSGINFYKSLAIKPRVIFTTAYPEFAVEGFELEAVDYLLKPFSYERFLTAVDKFKCQLASPGEDVLVIKQDKKHFRIPFGDIVLITSLRDYVKIQGREKSWISSDTLRSLESRLPTDQFIRIHKSHIVSTHHIDYLEGNQIHVGKEKLPVGLSYREKVNELFRK